MNYFLAPSVKMVGYSLFFLPSLLSIPILFVILQPK